MYQQTPRDTAAPVERYVAPSQIIPAAEQQLAPAPPLGMRVTGYRRIYGTELLEPIYGLPYEPPAPLPPAASGLDPQAQRLAAKGVFAAGAGVGAYYGMQALAIALDALVPLLIAAAVAAGVMLAPLGSKRGSTTTTIINQRGGMLSKFHNN